MKFMLVYRQKKSENDLLMEQGCNGGDTMPCWLDLWLVANTVLQLIDLSSAGFGGRNSEALIICG